MGSGHNPDSDLVFASPRINLNDFAVHMNEHFVCSFRVTHKTGCSYFVLRKSQELMFSHANSQRSNFETFALGCQVKGEITSIAAFGVFVNIGAEKDGLDLTSLV